MVRKSNLSMVLAASVVAGMLAGCGPSERDVPPPPSTVRRPVERPAPPAATPADETSQAGAGESETGEPATGDWGDLTGRFVYDGPPPEPVEINVTKDQEVCTKHNPVDESLVVAEDGSLANVVVYVRDEQLKIHPDYEASANEPMVLDNHECRFEPHVVAMRTTQPLLLKNSDPVGHNTNIAPLQNAAFNQLIASGSPQSIQFTNAERVPIPVACNIHPWMNARLLIRSSPYFAVSAKDGTFTIKNIPTGSHEFHFWHEPAFLRNIQVSGQETDRRGLAKLTIKPGKNDLGEIKIAASQISK